MKSIKKIIETQAILLSSGNINQEVSDIVIDSRKATNGSLYAALKGTQVDGHKFIDDAYKNGARSFLVEDEFENPYSDATYIQVKDVPSILGEICKAFNDYKSDDLVIIGCTGTNGKTTVTTLLYELFQYLGYKCGLISTVEYRIGELIYKSTHTTPDVVSLHRLLANMRDQECTHVFMEVSSHSIDQKRINGITFAGGIFTNITHDHLDYHKTFDNYIKAKKAFFNNLNNDAFSLTNKDDRNGVIMLHNTKSTRYTYGLHGTSDFNAKIIESDFTGMLLRFGHSEIWTPLVGKFNAYNLTAVYAAANLITKGLEDIEVAMSALHRVNGRFEALPAPNNITVIIDYAHTPDALENVINTIREIRKNESKIITVIGCGGNRDREKRPEMGKIAASLSDQCIFTSDNPRDEDPEIILDEMYAGVDAAHIRHILKITNREEAIKTSMLFAHPGDVILIAGKGHETYQEINGIKHDFDDKKTAIKHFNLIK